MFSFFDYIFYRICQSYSKTSASSPEGTAMVITSMMQGFNLITGIFVYVLISHNKISLNKYVGAGVAISLTIFNYIRYIYKESRSYKTLDAKWSNENSTLKIKKGVLTVLYIVISSVLFVGLAIYLGGKRY